MDSRRTGTADVILITGTEMATLPAARPLFKRTIKPIISSNICVGWAMLEVLGITSLAPPTVPSETLIGGWSERLARL